MEKVAMYKEMIYKEAKDKKYRAWASSDDPIFGQVFDYANELAHPDMSEEDEDLQFKRYINGVHQTANHPLLEKAIAEYTIPGLIDESRKGIDLFGRKKRRRAQYENVLSSAKGATEKLKADVMKYLKDVGDENLPNRNSMTDLINLTSKMDKIDKIKWHKFKG